MFCSTSLLTVSTRLEMHVCVLWSVSTEQVNALSYNFSSCLHVLVWCVCTSPSASALQTFNFCSSSKICTRPACTVTAPCLLAVVLLESTLSYLLLCSLSASIDMMFLSFYSLYTNLTSRYEDWYMSRALAEHGMAQRLEERRLEDGHPNWTSCYFGGSFFKNQVQVQVEFSHIGQTLGSTQCISRLNVSLVQTILILIKQDERHLLSFDLKQNKWNRSSVGLLGNQLWEEGKLVECICFSDRGLFTSVHWAGELSNN